jgi:hypothetical protein
MTEAEWKLLRALQPVALDRLCARILAEAEAVIADETRSSHERYLALYRLLRERDDDVADGFNDVRRSNAIQRMAFIVRMDLLTSDELERFSPQTRETVAFLAGRADDLTAPGSSSRRDAR